MLTKPTDRFIPPDSVPAQPPEDYRSGWFGSPAMWTMLADDGEVWVDLPQDADGFAQKTFWWSTLWDPGDEPMPAIVVTGRRLDGPGEISATGGTNAAADFGVAMLVGVIRSGRRLLGTNRYVPGREPVVRRLGCRLTTAQPRRNR